MSKTLTENLDLTETQIEWLDANGIKYDGANFRKGNNGYDVWYSVDSIWDNDARCDMYRCSANRWTFSFGMGYVVGADLYYGKSLKAALKTLTKCQPEV